MSRTYSDMSRRPTTAAKESAQRSAHIKLVIATYYTGTLDDMSPNKLTGPNRETLSFALATKALHGDHAWIQRDEVSPLLSLSTTFRHPTPEQLSQATDGSLSSNWDPSNPGRDIYSRYTQPTLTRTESALTAIIGQPTIAYPSGISAVTAILHYAHPDVIAVTDGYHGSLTAIALYREIRGEQNVKVIKLEDEYPRDGGKLLVWLETPLNPTGEARSIKFYADKAHAVGGIVAVDSTFAPPPIQDPFKWDCDIVMHSATKYFGGHSDVLAGTVSVKGRDAWLKLWHNRTYTGSNLGSLRVPRQVETATALAQWLQSLTRAAPGSDLDGPSGVVDIVWHSTLQADARELVGPGKQMETGSACFGLQTTKEVYATHLPHVLELFTPATSLGGVESLIEQRVLSAPESDPRLLRLSIGLEDYVDLKNDLIRGFNKVIKIEQGKTSRL
ncbi:hypothetical protein OIO90_000863 [Microbotryomycetes sp. JL221]|nr:hypothetical protein OIO90_000863 [Microbotryomycetes sp. JL221]